VSRTVVHLSDLHFGKVDSQVLDPLVETIHGLHPNVIAVSGDLTQRAKAVEFQQARAFLDRLPAPLVVVPGNHDVPLFNPYGRFVQRFGDFHTHITNEPVPEFVDAEIAVVGINTARSLTWKWGRVNRAQMTLVRDRLFALPVDVIRIVVMHHPFELPDGVSKLELVGRARMGMDKLAECGADVLLSGHLHSAHVSDTVRRYNIYGHSALVVQAGTATSIRQRGEQNSFNCLRTTPTEITIESWAWRTEPAGGSSGFHPASIRRFLKRNRLWIPATEG
jgi:3',5'-cyclic AMP phosphodiesterase CpdA